MLRSGSPWTLAASMKSAVRKLSAWDRTARASPAHAVMAMIPASTKGLLVRMMLAITMTRGRPGMVRKTSAIRISTMSTAPPR